MNDRMLALTIEKNIAIVKINNPPANTLSSACIQDLRTLLKELAIREDIYAIIITGSGRFFVAGADIKEFTPALGDYNKGLALAEAGQALCNEVEALNKPVIAAINGPALGGGMELVMACHYRIASDTATLGLPELKLGLIPSFGGTQRLSRLTSTATALELILSGKQLRGEEAEKLGIVQLVVSSNKLIDTALTITRSFLDGKSMTSVTRAVKCVIKGYNETLESGLERERNEFAALFLTEDAKEGIQAFVEKRPPHFRQS